MEQTVWIATLNYQAGEIDKVLGVFESHDRAVCAIEDHAGKLDWQIKELPDAPGPYKALLSDWLEGINRSVAIYPVSINALYGAGILYQNREMEDAFADVGSDDQDAPQ